MAGYRNRFIKHMNWLGSQIPLKWMMGLSGQKLVVPLYHAVSDNPPPHLKNLYKVRSTKAFSRDLDYLQKHFQPINVDELKEVVAGKRKLRQPSFLLTFDDGLRSFGEVVAPMLESRGLTAINFLNSAFVDNKDLMFRYKSSLLIETLKTEPGLMDQKNVLNWFEKRGRLELNEILRVGYNKRQLLDELAEGINYNFHEFLVDERPYLESSEIQDLVKSGFVFGAHSIDHPEFRFIPLDEQLRQTSESTHFVQQLTTKNSEFFAFPFTDFGVSKKYFSQAKINNNPQLFFGTAGLKKGISFNRIQRISMEIESVPASRLIPTEYLYYLSKMPFGKHKMS